MTKLQTQVKEFHQAFDILINDKPTLADEATKKLRAELIHEELDEFTSALIADDLVEAADALGDLLYVIYGAAVSFGIDLEPITDEIHRSNMSKVGGHKADNGKWVKPSTYSPANLEPIIQAQSEADSAWCPRCEGLGWDQGFPCPEDNCPATAQTVNNFRSTGV